MSLPLLAALPIASSLARSYSLLTTRYSLLLMDYLAQLNPEQREAVLHVDGPLLILAGAGSGKTRVIVHRIAHLIGEGHARPGEVLAVTFTNKAAEEMRGRVARLIGSESEQVWLSTFHSLCARLLRREAPNIGLSRAFVIYDSADQLSAAKQVMRELQIDEALIQPRAALSRISHAKNRMETPEAMAAHRGNPREEIVARIFARYQAFLASSGALDFDDLLLKAVQLLKDTEAGRRYASRFRYVLVDEYQDTNRPQYLLIRHLAAAHQNICVVGDPDQSIYQWRGADLKNILDFEEDFPDAKVVRLERNYRSTQIILDAATSVISRNLLRKEKRLWTERTGGERITYLRAGDEIEEADFIARTARMTLREDDARMAVLYRINAQSRVLEDALRREGVAYRIIGNVRFYDRKEIKDALAYLKLMLNPDDDVSFRRIVNVPARGIGKSVMDALERAVGHDTPLLGDTGPSSSSLWARLEQGLKDGAFAGRQAASLRAFHDLMVGLRDMAAHEALSAGIGKMLDRSGYLGDLREDRSEESEARIENLAELVSAAREFEARQAEGTLAAFVDQLSLLSDVDEEQGSRDARVLLMTLHSAKGLEFPVVVIAGMEEGLFPHARANDEAGDLEEERRLCYVGMTRAQDRLLLTGAARRRVFGEYRNTEPSRFIDEVPTALLREIPGEVQSYRSSFLQPEYRPGSSFRRRPPRVREEQPSGFRYENEDQSAVPFGPGTRVRHPQFGVGTVQAIEQIGDDFKFTVKFASVGQKRLIGKYAKLELA
jgi:DNA helicase-2/ATP-dependent DNA helicase PcrA